MRRLRLPRGWYGSLGVTVGLVALVAAGAADRGGLLPLAVLGAAALAMGGLYVLVRRGPEFAFGTACGLAMYATLYVVVGRADFPDARPGIRALGFLLPVSAFVLAAWMRRDELATVARLERPLEHGHLSAIARRGLLLAGITVAAAAFPRAWLNATGQGTLLLATMTAVSLVVAASVGEVVRLLAEVALILREVARGARRLAVPVVAYVTLYALIAIVFGCVYRVADGLSRVELFANPTGPVRLDFSDAMHFSVATLSTVGYGDIRPVEDGVRVLASLQVLLGQLLLLFGFAEIMRGSGADRPAPRDASRPEPATEAARSGPGPGAGKMAEGASGPSEGRT